jgi:nicotinate-nucleotide adenylyltransferase
MLWSGKHGYANSWIDDPNPKHCRNGITMKVGIIGGAFNPPTWGHIRVAQVAIQHVDEVWLQPCFNHMYGKDMASPQQRLEMCRLAAQEAADPNIFPVRASSYEIDQQLECCTHDMLKRLRDHTNQYNISYHFIIGQDNADEIEKWEHHEQLVEEFSFIVIPRIGFTLPEKDWYRHPPHVYIAGTPVPEISSTEVRNLLEDGSSNRLMETCPGSIVEYIQRHGLYNGKT